MQFSQNHVKLHENSIEPAVKLAFIEFWLLIIQ
jgi:hypothetical protein